MSFRQLSCAVLGACAVALAALPACEDNVADPIVLVTQGGSGNVLNTDPPSGLCDPCRSNADCQDFNDSCVQISRGDPHFCSRACENDAHCPDGFICDVVDNLNALQCIPISGACDTVQ